MILYKGVRRATGKAERQVETGIGVEAIQVRERLRDEYLKCLNELGAAWEARDDQTLARTCHERVQKVETALELSYQATHLQ